MFHGKLRVFFHRHGSKKLKRTRKRLVNSEASQTLPLQMQAYCCLNG